jgi:hypothetical protein
MPEWIWRRRAIMNKQLLGVLAALALVTPASAAVVVGPTINGFDTFTDTNTGRNWVKLDSFFNQTHNYMAAIVTDAGFTVAERPAVEELLGSLPLDGGQWPGYAAVMGQAPNRELIWGSYDPVVNNLAGWAFAFDDYSAWDLVDSIVFADQVPNGGTDFADMNIWAYADGDGVIPEPATWAMLVTGFGLVGFAARRRRFAHAA